MTKINNVTSMDQAVCQLLCPSKCLRSQENTATSVWALDWVHQQAMYKSDHCGGLFYILTKIVQPILTHQENLYQSPKLLFRYREDNQIYENNNKLANYQILRQSMTFIQIVRNWIKKSGLKNYLIILTQKNFQAVQGLKWTLKLAYIAE